MENLQIEQLIRQLGGDDYTVDKATEALTNIGVVAVPPLIEALHEWNEKLNDFENIEKLIHISSTLSKIGLPALQFLITALKDNDWQVRAYVAKTIGDIKNPQATESLVDKLNDENSFVRAEAVQALGKIGDKKAVEPLIALLAKEEEVYVKYSVIFSLGDLSDKKALPVLEQIEKQDTNIVFSGRTLADIAKQKISNIKNNG